MVKKNKEENVKRLIAKFIGPLAGVGALFAVLAYKKAYIEWALALAYFFAPSGRMAILAAPLLELNIGIVALIFILFDGLLAIFVIWNFWILREIPLVGKFVIKAEKRAHRALVKKPWLEKMSLLGIVAFVALPFWGSNAIVGSFIGKLLELDTLPLWTGVVIGSILGTLIFIGPVYLIL